MVSGDVKELGRIK